MRLLVLLAALLASAPRSDAQHVNFYRMSSNGCATGVKTDTGYSAPVIKYVWRKYRAQLINAARGYEGFRFVVNEGDDALAEYVGLCLYAALWYMHIYPTVAGHNLGFIPIEQPPLPSTDEVRAEVAAMAAIRERATGGGSSSSD